MSALRYHQFMTSLPNRLPNNSTSSNHNLYNLCLPQYTSVIASHVLSLPNQSFTYNTSDSSVYLSATNPPEMYPSYYIYVQMYSSIYGLWVNIESAMNLSIGNHIFKVDNKHEAWHCVNSLSMTFIYLLPLNEQFNIYICVYRSETTPTIFMRFRKQGVSGRSMIHY